MPRITVCGIQQSHMFIAICRCIRWRLTSDALSVGTNLHPIFFYKTEDSAENQHIITDFIVKLLVEERCSYLQQDSTRAHMSALTMCFLWEMLTTDLFTYCFGYHCCQILHHRRPLWGDLFIYNFHLFNSLYDQLQRGVNVNYYYYKPSYQELWKEGGWQG